MITDEYLKLSNQQAIIPAKKISENVIDLKSDIDISTGRDVFFVFNVDVELVKSGTINIKVVSASNVGLTADVTVLSSKESSDNLMLGELFYLTLNHSYEKKGNRYIGVIYDGVTSGTVTCSVVLDVQESKIYKAV